MASEALVWLVRGVGTKQRVLIVLPCVDIGIVSSSTVLVGPG